MSFGASPNKLSEDSAPACPRHPDRVSYVRCQQCERPVCPECQQQAAVGVQCPDCVKKSAQKSSRWLPSTRNTRPVITLTLMAICFTIYIFEVIPGSNLINQLAYVPVFTEAQPWRMITSIFTHSLGITHILFNMFALYTVGMMLEPLLGRLRFFLLFLISGFGGSVAYLLFAEPTNAVVGASGAIFGLFGAVFVVFVKRKEPLQSILVLFGVNIIFGFVFPGIAWEAHLGGLAVGITLAAIMMYFPQMRSKRWLQYAGMAGVIVILLGLTVWRVTQIPQFLVG